MNKKELILKRRKRKKPKKTVIQNHHITYNPEKVVRIYKGEHYILTLLQWRKKHSKGFAIALRHWLKEHKDLDKL